MSFSALQSEEKIVRLIAKERLSGPPSPIVNVELVFEGICTSPALFVNIYMGGEEGKLGSLKVFAPDCKWIIKIVKVLLKSSAKYLYSLQG